MIQARQQPSPERELQGIIGEGTTLEGEFVFEGGYRVDGRIAGRLSSGSVLIVGPRGELDVQELRVRTLIVHGTVRGDLQIDERLEIEKGGRVYGHVTMSQPGFVVDAGGVFEGQITMQREATEPA